MSQVFTGYLEMVWKWRNRGRGENSGEGVGSRWFRGVMVSTRWNSDVARVIRWEEMKGDMVKRGIFGVFWWFSANNGGAWSSLVSMLEKKRGMKMGRVKLCGG
ncbi:hypothetical protein HAX54_045968, partial [Datura stramonium]|nr:hypothetical protein [Datura stramonium]